jgi:glyoxylase-like metal-dependent hydrolase (beta-lactamase superfamily II)
MAPVSTALIATEAETNNQPDIFTSFHPGPGTWQYLVIDQHTSVSVIIDSVLDFDPVTNRISTETAGTLLNLVAKHDVKVERIMETHAHADHLTAARYLQAKLFQQQQSRPNICIGKRILQVHREIRDRYGRVDWCIRSAI